MKKMLHAIICGIGNFFNGLGEEVAKGIEQRNGKQIAANAVLIIVYAVLLFLLALLLLLLALKFWWVPLLGFIAASWLYNIAHKERTVDSGKKGCADEVEIELARQRGLEMQGAVINFMLRVISAISPFTVLIRPREERDIEVLNSSGEGFYMKDDIVIYQVEAEVEVEVKGKITPEVEDTLQSELQRFAVKYVQDYPMLISPEAGGSAPIEILRAKGSGGRVLIDLVFATEKSIPYIKTCRRARVDRQKRQERTRDYIDEDYGE